MNSRVVAVTAAVLLLGATPTPPPSVPPAVTNVIENIVQTVTQNAVAPYAVDPNHVRGAVTYFRRFDLQVRLPLNVYKDVHLHQGTVINPRGATIADGQVVDVHGHAQADGSIDADDITILH
jgi:hypothetical protein